jgi:hypothetical protein
MAKERHVTWRKLQPSIDLLGRAIQHQLTALSRMSFLSRELAEVAGTVSNDSNGTIDIPAELIFFPGHHRPPAIQADSRSKLLHLSLLSHVFTMFSPCFRNRLPAPNHLRA